MSIERAAGGSSQIDVLDRVLDKGIVIDAWLRLSLVGIDLVTLEARVVVASIATYLQFSDLPTIQRTVGRLQRVHVKRSTASQRCRKHQGWIGNAADEHHDDRRPPTGSGARWGRVTGRARRGVTGASGPSSGSLAVHWSSLPATDLVTMASVYSAR